MQGSICATAKNKKSHKNNSNDRERGGRRGDKRRPIGRNRAKVGVEGDFI